MGLLTLVSLASLIQVGRILHLTLGELACAPNVAALAGSRWLQSAFLRLCIQLNGLCRTETAHSTPSVCWARARRRAHDPWTNGSTLGRTPCRGMCWGLARLVASAASKAGRTPLLHRTSERCCLAFAGHTGVRADPWQRHAAPFPLNRRVETGIYPADSLQVRTAW